MEAVRTSVLALLVCGLVASSIGQEQPDANVQVSGFLYELLLTHLAAFEDRIGQRLDELGRNQTHQTELLQSLRVRAPIAKPATAMPRQSLRGRPTITVKPRLPSDTQRPSACDRLMIACQVVLVESLPDRRLHGEWIVMQTRFDGSVSFHRDWLEYGRGFGDVQSGEYWLGLRTIYWLLRTRRHELLILLETFDNESAYASYDEFRVRGDFDQFALQSLGNYSGTAGDSLSYHVGSKFSTHDRDHDSHQLNCAEMYRGGWWYKDCYSSNLNGNYVTKPSNKEEGLIWLSFKGAFGSMKSSQMLIRPYVDPTRRAARIAS